MSQSKGKLIVVILVFAILAMSSLACDELDQMSSGFKSADPTPMAKAWVPPSQRGDLTVEQENELLSEVEFSLSGTPSGEVAVFIDATMLIRLTVGKKVRVPLEGNDRCGVNLKVLNAEGDWEHTTSVGCIDHTPYASIGFTVDGTSVKVSESSWR